MISTLEFSRTSSYLSTCSLLPSASRGSTKTYSIRSNLRQHSTKNHLHTSFPLKSTYVQNLHSFNFIGLGFAINPNHRHTFHQLNKSIRLSATVNNAQGREADVHIISDSSLVDVKVHFGLDGAGVVHCDTGLPFLDHMIDQLGTHGLLDINVQVQRLSEAATDEIVNNTVGKAIGTAIAQLGLQQTKVSAEFFSPLDESLQSVHVDLCGSGSLHFDTTIPTRHVGRYPTKLVQPFFANLADAAGVALTVQRLTPASNCNSHHIIEASFKAFARALRRAIDIIDNRTVEASALIGPSVRSASLARSTGETDISVSMTMDGRGDHSECSTSIALLDRQLAAIAEASSISFDIQATGDTHIDDHHTIEDTAIVIGKVLQSALGDRSGINRMGFGSATVGFSTVHATLDLSGRPHLGFDVDFKDERINEYDTQLVEHTYQSLVNNSGLTLHIRLLDGTDSEDTIMAIAEAVGSALRMGIQYDPRRAGKIASSKGVL